MQWSDQQNDALRAVHNWLHNSSDQVFHLFGYAGSGKTTLAKHFAEGVDGIVYFAAYTGKAAHVLQQKGCRGATTIHQLIYHTRDKGKNRLREFEKQYQTLVDELSEAGKSVDEIKDHPRVKEFQKMIVTEREALKQPMFVKNPESEIVKAKLVIIDECSMVDDRMGEDLLSFGVKVLVLGDPAQLPPVAGSGYFTEGVKPNVMLTDIHRQAEESPIIQLATKVRMGETLPLCDFGDVRVITGKVDPEQVLQFDQILVWKNITRKASNNRVRSLLGYEDPYPVVGDRLVCKRNDHDAGLLNGALYDVAGVSGVMDEKVAMEIVPLGTNFAQEVMVHEHYFLGRDEELQWFEKREAQEFDYGYALTVHSAQGSQWDSVLLFDEYKMKKDRDKWLYTAITRAAKSLTVVKM